MPTERGVSACELCKVYGSGKKKRIACSGINLDAGPGAITGILGLNGAGKSTMLKMLSGISYPSSGSVSVCGCTDFAVIRSLVGFVPESPRLEGGLYVHEFLAMSARLCALPYSDSVLHIKKAVEICQLGEVLCQKISSLSRGFAQRVSLARALSFNPPVLILDEFSGGLDPSQQSRFRTALKELSAEKTILLSTHNIAEAQSLCSRLYVLDHGTVRAEGTPGQICSATGTNSLEKAFLALTAGEARDE